MDPVPSWLWQGPLIQQPVLVLDAAARRWLEHWVLCTGEEAVVLQRWGARNLELENTCGHESRVGELRGTTGRGRGADGHGLPTLMAFLLPLSF